MQCLDLVTKIQCQNVVVQAKSQSAPFDNVNGIAGYSRAGACLTPKRDEDQTSQQQLPTIQLKRGAYVTKTSDHFNRYYPMVLLQTTSSITQTEMQTKDQSQQ
jgi:hypothetical protein